MLPVEAAEAVELDFLQAEMQTAGAEATTRRPPSPVDVDVGDDKGHTPFPMGASRDAGDGDDDGESLDGLQDKEAETSASLASFFPKCVSRE